jgi:hypothetical protein
MLTFNIKPFLIFIALLLIEILIAMYVHDAYIRPFFGDFLAVIALYFLLKTFLKLQEITLALISVGFAYFLEFLQYCEILKITGLKKYKIIAIILGSSFDWRDIFAYTLGILAVFLFSKETLALDNL